MTASIDKEKLKKRSEVPAKDKWNVEELYPNMDAWEKDFKEFARPEKKPHWPELTEFQGKLGGGPTILKKFLVLEMDLDRNLSKLYTWAHMRYDEDLTNDSFKKLNSMITMVYHDFGQELSWVEPEILALSDETIKKYLESEELKDYRIYLEKIVRMKPHILSIDKEQLMAMAGKALGTSSKAFGAFNNADLKFPKVEDGKKNKLDLTHGTFSLYLRSQDRTLRKNAFETMHSSFLSYENTLCELINGQVQNHLFTKNARNFSSCLEAALFPNEIDLKVYTNLIETVRKNLPKLHRYMKLRKKALQVDELHLYDLYVPLLKDVEMKYDYKTAEEMVVSSVAPLGDEYQKDLAEGLTKQRWVDRYENENKRSGAYSSGCYDSMPYILMNYHGAFHDMTTLAHEAGHSMHSLMSHRHQPYQYSHYPIFVAEVASTFNEELLFHKLLASNLSEKERTFLINQKVEDIRATFFRQTMFAEFELRIHRFAETDIPLTPTLLKEVYRELNRDYFGPDVMIDKEIDIEWARIPHFYYNFYVYQYATGISAAYALFEKVMSGDEAARKAYIKFLSSGSSQYPLDLLQLAGVNMKESLPIESILNKFDRLVTELFTLMKVE